VAVAATVAVAVAATVAVAVAATVAVAVAATSADADADADEMDVSAEPSLVGEPAAVSLPAGVSLPVGVAPGLLVVEPAPLSSAQAATTTTSDSAPAPAIVAGSPRKERMRRSYERRACASRDERPFTPSHPYAAGIVRPDLGPHGQSEINWVLLPTKKAGAS
jgi:hypothetical protein